MDLFSYGVSLLGMHLLFLSVFSTCLLMMLQEGIILELGVRIVYVFSAMVHKNLLAKDLVMLTKFKSPHKVSLSILTQIVSKMCTRASWERKVNARRSAYLRLGWRSKK